MAGTVSYGQTSEDVSSIESSSFEAVATKNMSSIAITTEESAVKDLAKVNKQLSSASSLHLKMTYATYKNWTATKPLHTEFGELKTKGQNKYQKIGPLEMVTTDKFNFTIHHTDKFITLQASSKKDVSSEASAKEDVMPFDITALNKMCSSITKMKLANNLTGYSFNVRPGLSEYARVDIIFDANTFFIKKMVLFSDTPESYGDQSEAKQKARMEITYTEVITSAKFKAETFTYSKYLLGKGQQAKLKEAYKDHNFIYQPRLPKQ
ncbi:MAG: hypothetical protein HRT71_10905 [Flavobacteriales bacterium]|nr:hypothetical protein [Flavobacteriales bacterium]